MRSIKNIYQQGEYMEAELYFKCPICGKKILKRKGIKVMWTTICKDCYNRMDTIYDDSKQRSNGN